MVPVFSWRSLGSSVKWADLNPGPDSYDWTNFDKWTSAAENGGQDVMYTMYATPAWASSRGSNCSGVGEGCLGAPNTSCAFANTNGPGICDPPSDLNCDGSGSDQIFQTFVAALLNHVGPGKIKYWEMWNEPNISSEWNGASDCPGVVNAQYLMLARMAKDMRAIVSAADPNAKFTSPPATGPGPGGAADWIQGYFSSSDGASSADIVGFHGYVQSGACPQNCPQPEDVLIIIQNLTALNLQGKPLFDTEGSWGDVNQASAITDADQQAAFTGRYYLLQMGSGVAKLYWYGWDFLTTGFYDPSTQSLNEAGVAYQQIVSWTDGKQVAPCTNHSTVWSCTISSGGTQSQATWDSAQTCNNRVCTTSNQAVPSQYTGYLDLAGNKHSIQNGAAPVGAKPILLVTQ